MSKQYILAIHAGHNASALIGTHEGLLYAVQEERLTGEKNYWGWPAKSIEQCLAHTGVTVDQLDKVVFGARQLFFRYHTREEVVKGYERHDDPLGRVRQEVLMPLVRRFMKTYGQKEALEKLQALGVPADKVHFYEHHTSHAATAYYGLRKNTEEDYLVLTCDGSGEELCATVRVMGPNGKDEVVATSHWNNSLGALYAWVTYRMGFVPLEHEYKLMGMAPYAAKKYTEPVKEVFKSFLWLDESGLKFKRSTRQRISDSSQTIMNKLKGIRFDSLCGGLQSFSEEILAEWVKNAVQATGVKKVLAAGGVFMNVKANQIIAEVPGVDYFEAFPSCGDETLSFGAFYQQLAQDAGHANVPPLGNYYTGDDIDDAEVAAILKDRGHEYYQPDNLADEVARILVEEQQPLARCAGRMEYGARALGNRSILADPKNSDVVRVINQMVKKRDFWMPFAPMMMAERAEDYIVNEKGLDSPYMMMTFNTRDNFRDMIAAVHNADLTCRAQLLHRDQNPQMHDILQAFEARTGRAVVLNTSYNLHGYPIARTPEEGLYILENSGLQYLQLGSYIVKKRS